MVVMLAIGAMSVTWMCVVAVAVLAQKLLPPNGLIDLPVTLALLGLGVAIVAAPSSVPGLIPPM